MKPLTMLDFVSDYQHIVVRCSEVEEASEMLELRLKLPTAGQQREEAKARIAQKIAKRKAKTSLDSGTES